MCFTGRCPYERDRDETCILPKSMPCWLDEQAVEEYIEKYGEYTYDKHEYEDL